MARPKPSASEAIPALADPVSGYANLDTAFHHLIDTVRTYRPGDDLNLIRRAWAFCIEQHADQKRASGEPYIGHPLEVAQVLAEFKMDATAIAAGLLHDAVEDTDVTAAEIGKRFGEQVAPHRRRASPSSTRSSSPTAKTIRPRTSARCCSLWSPICAW